MGTIYVDTGGSNTNSGTTDTNAATLTGANATWTGTTTVTLDGAPDLSGLSTSGANQAAIHLNNATNSNKKIFWITAVDNVAKTVTVDAAPTGASGSAWAIGGRHAASASGGINTIEGALRAGDTVILNNSPAACSGAWLTCRTAGTSADGRITIKGKDGVRPVINITGVAIPINGGAGHNWWFIDNLQIDQDAASGNAINGIGPGSHIRNVKVVDTGGMGFLGTDASTLILGCEFSGCGSHGLNPASDGVVYGCYIHDNGGDGILNSVGNGDSYYMRNIIESNTGRGINDTGATTIAGMMLWIEGNTIYGNGNSGLEVADVERGATLINNIFSENGNAAGEYNVEWLAGNAERLSLHSHNVFYHSGGGGGANLSGLTVNSFGTNEYTTDPGFTDAANGDFSISSSSPAKAAGYPSDYTL